MNEFDFLTVLKRWKRFEQLMKRQYIVPKYYRWNFFTLHVMYVSIIFIYLFTYIFADCHLERR